MYGFCPSVVRLFCPSVVRLLQKMGKFAFFARV